MLNEPTLTEMICPSCGRPARSEARFCGACGARLTAAPAPASADFALGPAQPAAIGQALARGDLLGHRGRYRVERALGRGGYGETFMATDTQLKRLCVIKRPLRPTMGGAGPWQRAAASFEHEAQFLVSLNTPGHPHIPDIYEYLADQHCLVMKYIEGRSLDQILDRRVAPLPEDEALNYTRDVCSALVYMHARRPEPVVHRDIKPANILLDATDRIWLIDFGLAKAFGEHYTLRSRGAGTLGFTPPEQWQGSAVPRSDVFALMATLHVLLTLYQPDHAELIALMHGRGNGLPPARALNPALGAAVERLIQRGTAFDIAARPTASALLDELDALLNESVIAPPARPARLPEIADFVGRSTELAALEARLTSDRRAVITGPAGIGKTALAATLARRVRSPELIFWHSFYQDQGMEAIIWELGAFLAERGQSELWRVLQGARTTSGQAPPPEVLIDYIIAMTQGQNYLLCFDNVQFVDDDPRFVLFVQRLTAQAQAGQVDLIMVSRHRPAFADRAEIAPLAGLSADDAGLLLRRYDLALPEPSLAALHAATEGNAQFLVLSSQAFQRAHDTVDLGQRLVATDDIAHYLLTEVDAGLTEEQRDVLSAVASLQGYGGTREAIEALLDRPRIQQALHELARRHLLAARADQAGQVYQLHAIVQAFYYQQLSKRERATFHRRAGVFYEAEQIDRLKAARHFALAGEYARAAQLATGDIWAIINRGQVKALRQVLEQFTAQQLDVLQWSDVSIARSEVYTLLRESALAQAGYTAAFEQLAGMAPSYLTHMRKAHICRGLGELLEYEAPQQALNWLRKGLAELDAAKALSVSQELRQEEALLYLRIGAVLIAMGKYPAARDALDQSVGLLPAGASQSRASALLKLGVVYCAQGQTQAGTQYYLQALEIQQQLGNFWGMVGAWHNLGIELVFAGDWAGAEAQYRNALAMAERLGNVTRRATLELSLGYLAINQGDMERARSHLTTCLDLARAHSLKEYVISSQSSLADMYLRLGEWALAEPLLSAAEHLALEMDAQWQLPEIYRGRAELQLGLGQAPSALQAAERATDLAHDLEDPREEGMGLRILAQAQLAAGRAAEALDSFERSLGLLDERDPYEAARARLHWGLALASLGDRQQGFTLVEAARTTFQTLGARHDLLAATSACSSAERPER